MNARGIIARQPLEERDGVLYFIRPPADIVPSRDRIPRSRRTWSFWRRENYAFLQRELATFRRGATLIDLGAGQSDFADLTARFSACAVDFYPYPGVHVVCNLAEPLPLRDAVADIVLATNLLEHVREPDRVLAECHRILKPGGVLLGTVPFLIEVHQRPYDFYRYTDRALEHLLGRHRFGRVTVTSVSDLYTVLCNASVSFFTGAIRSARWRLPWRILWRAVRAVGAASRRTLEGRYRDPDSPLGYLFRATRQHL